MFLSRLCTDITLQSAQPRFNLDSLSHILPFTSLSHILPFTVQVSSILALQHLPQSHFSTSWPLSLLVSPRTPLQTTCSDSALMRSSSADLQRPLVTSGMPKIFSSPTYQLPTRPEEVGTPIFYSTKVHAIDVSQLAKHNIHYETPADSQQTG